MLDAYTVRKAIPRLLLAVIAINLSIYLCIAALDITSVIGHGLNQLIAGPFINADSFSGVKIPSDSTSNVTGVLASGATMSALALALYGAVGAATASIVSVLGLIAPLIITVILIALAVLFTLVIRQGLIIFLTILSPVAFVLYILPGTEKYFKQWGDLYIRTLAVYPIIAAIFAVSNAMGAILLNTAAGQGQTSSMLSFNQIMAQQNGPIGTLQIIAAIMVLYMPLVLIPFSFKLAGGAISAVMNAAQGQASGMSGKLGDRIRKAREDQNTWLGKNAFQAKSNRLERGATPGQMIHGISGGIRAKKRGNTFREGFSAYSSARGATSMMKEKDAVLESDAVKAISANDDTVHAWYYGKDEASVRKLLEDRGYHGKDLLEATANVMYAKKQGSVAVNRMAAFQAQAGTGTGFKTVEEFNEQLIQSSGGDKNTMGRLLASGREAAIKAGRVEQGIASYGTHFANVASVMDTQAGSEERATASAEAASNILDSAIDAAPGSQAMQGKPQSAEALADAWNKRRVKYERNLVEATETGDGQAIQTAKQDLTRVMAQIASVQEAMSHSSPQNARQFSNKLMGVELEYKNLSQPEREMYKTAFEVVGDVDDGKGGTKRGVTAMKTKITVAEAFDSLRSNADFQTMRREFSSAVDERVAGQAQQATEAMMSEQAKAAEAEKS